MVNLPKIRKKITSFLVKEEGKISKDKLVKAGIIIAAIGSVGSVQAGWRSVSHSCDPDCPSVNCASVGDDVHGNALTFNYNNPNAAGSHGHCIESHTSHNSHGSCSTWNR